MALAELEHSHARPVRLLFHAPRPEQGVYHGGGLFAYPGSPAAEPVAVPLEVFPVALGHVRLHRGVLAGPSAQPRVARDAFVPVEDLHGGVGQARFHLFFYILVGYGVVHPVQGDVVVELDRRRFPLRHFEGCGGKGLQQGAFLALEDFPPAAFLLLELARVERLQPFPYGFVQFREREELLVAQRGRYPRGYLADVALDARLVLGVAHPCRDDGRPVVFRHLAVGPVQLRRVPVAAGVVYRRRAVVGNEHRGHPAEVVVHVHVRPDPVPRLLVGERLHVGVLAVRQSRDEQVGVHGFTRVRVDDVRRVPGPVHLHGFRGAAGDAHCRPAFLFLLLDVVAELRVHERLAVAEPAALAVFGPKQFLRHAVPEQLLADVLEVYRVARLCRFPVGEERLLDCRVVHAFGMRPVDPGRVRRLHDTFHRVAGYARRPCDVPLAEAEMLQPEDFAVFGHVTSIGKPVATLRRAIPL